MWVGGGGGGGGELVKEVDFAFMLCFCIYALLLFCASPFCDVQWLAGSPFYKAVILYSLLFQNLDPFLQSNFLWFCLTCGLKIEALSNSIDVRLVPCLVE